MRSTPARAFLMRKLLLFITNERSSFVACSSVRLFSSAPISAAASLIIPIRFSILNHLTWTNDTSQVWMGVTGGQRLFFLPLRPNRRAKKPFFLGRGVLAGVGLDQVVLTVTCGVAPDAVVVVAAGAISAPVT